MSRKGSHHNYQDDEEINLYDRNEAGPVQQPPRYPPPPNLDKCQDKNLSTITTMGITTTVHLLWENLMPQNSKRSRGAFARALN
ncbi:unnamed protein product [Rhodiola kirilowii]